MARLPLPLHRSRAVLVRQGRRLRLSGKASPDDARCQGRNRRPSEDRSIGQRLPRRKLGRSVRQRVWVLRCRHRPAPRRLRVDGDLHEGTCSPTDTYGTEKAAAVAICTSHIPLTPRSRTAPIGFPALLLRATAGTSSCRRRTTSRVERTPGRTGTATPSLR